MTLNVVGVVCALASEARHLGPVDGTLVRVSGMGMAAATRCATSLVDEGATALVSWGMAGGLDPRLTPGTIFLPDTVISTTGVALGTAGPWRERLGAAVSALHPVIRGRLLTSVRAVGSLADKATLFRETGAVAVDMESSAVGEVAQSHQLPFIAVRVIVSRGWKDIAMVIGVHKNSKRLLAHAVDARRLPPFFLGLHQSRKQ